MVDVNGYQYKDLLIRPDDPYAIAKYDIVLSGLGDGKALRILNAGCGSGELSFLLARAGHTVMGIDVSSEYIALARKNVPADVRDRCTFSVTSIERMDASGDFDCVIAMDVLEHVRDDAALARKLAGLTRPGGYVIITVPAMPSLFGYHDEQIGHFRRYRAGQLKKLMEDTGRIRIETIRHFGFSLVPVCAWYSVLRRRPYPRAPYEREGHSFQKTVLRFLLTFEKRIRPPFGTSLILFGIRNA